MLTYAPGICDVREPKADYNGSQRSRHKQIARIICHLRDQLHGTYPQLNMPTRWMVECLVFNACGDEVLQSGDWESIVINSLKSMRTLANAHLRSSYRFTRRDGVTSLFPNQELFDEWDVFRFCQTLLQHLEQELNPQ